MYPITNEVKALFEAEQRKVLRITGTDKNGAVISITDNDVIADSFQVDRYSCNGEKLEVGTAISAQMSLTLENGGGQYNGIVFEGAELFVEVGIADWTQSSPTITYVPCGYFTPDEQPRRLSTISITGLDRMTKFDVVVDAAALTFPTTVAGLVGQVCTLCGVTLAQSISGLVNAGVNVAELPTAQEEITYRNLIQWCAGVMGTNAWFDWNGQLRFSWYANATGYVSTADNRYSSDLYEDDLTVSGVEYTNDSGIVIVEGTDDYAIDLTGNAIVGPLVATVLPPLNTALNGFTYRPFTAATVNAPYLWPMDIVTFTDKDGNNHTSALTNVAFGLNGTTAMESKGMTYAINKLAQPKGFTREQAQLVSQAMEHVEQDIDDSLTQQEIFNRLTDNGAAQGLLLYNGQLYINASYINAGYLSADRIAANSIAVSKLTGSISNNGWVLDLSNGTLTIGNISADKINGGTIDGGTVNAKLLNIVDANGNVIASFNNVITLGKTTDAHAELDFNSFEIKNKVGDSFFVVSDVRDANGRATVADLFMGTGYTTLFTLSVQAISVTGVTIDGTAASGWSLTGGRMIQFVTAPANGAEIVVTYVTDAPVYRYDIGERWTDSVIGARSVAAGYYVEASGFGSYAEGQATHAKGYLSHVEGYYSQANGYVTHAEGYDTKAVGHGSHAEGRETEASGINSHAEGNSTEASGECGHAEGGNTVASGGYSHAEGYGTIASAIAQHVVGKYNVSDNLKLEIVGNGTNDSNRSNARTLDESGNEWIAGALSVGNAATTRANLGVTPANIGAVAKSGDTINGNLIINGNLTVNADGNIDLASDYGVTIGDTDAKIVKHSDGTVHMQSSGDASVYVTNGGNAEIRSDGGAASIILTPNGDVNVSGDVALDAPLPVTSGGTGATTAAQARANIGAVAKSGDTMTGPLTVPQIYSANAAYPAYLFANAQNTQVADIYYDIGNKSFIFRYDPNGQEEHYELPTSTGSGGHYILTDKSPVTIPQGGTGATTPDGACANIGAVKKSGDTMTGPLTVPNMVVRSGSWQFYFMQDSNGAEVGHVRGDEAAHQIAFREITPGTNGTAYEDYYLPNPTIQSGAASYFILTSKSAVTIPQGGTGATDAPGARANLGIATTLTTFQTEGITANGNFNTGLKPSLHVIDAIYCTAGYIAITPYSNSSDKWFAHCINPTTGAPITSNFNVTIRYHNIY